jgi:hypothetical protein
MVEVMIGEMYGSDRSRPIDYTRALVVDAEVHESETEHCSERTEECSQKRFDRTDIVRDVL